MALYRRKRTKDRRHGAPPPGYPREHAYVPNPTFDSTEKAPDPTIGVEIHSGQDSAGDVTKKTQ